MRLVLEKRAEASTRMAILSPVIAIVLTLVTGGIIFALRGLNPFSALYVFFVEPLTTSWSIEQLIVKAAPLAMIGAGWLTDRMNRAWLLAAIYFGRSLVFLLLPPLAQDASILWLFAVLFGIFDYATVPPTASLAAGHLGRARVGTAMGLISAGHSIGGALGAFMGGSSRSW